jgi:hypothetical protein
LSSNFFISPDFFKIPLFPLRTSDNPAAEDGDPHTSSGSKRGESRDIQLLGPDIAERQRSVPGLEIANFFERF